MRKLVISFVGILAIGAFVAACGDDNGDPPKLDKNKVYLIYCASGSRSGNAHDTMRSQGFHEVYNMLGGFGTFQNLEGAGAFLEP